MGCLYMYVYSRAKSITPTKTTTKMKSLCSCSILHYRLGDIERNMPPALSLPIWPFTNRYFLQSSRPRRISFLQGYVMDVMFRGSLTKCLIAWWFWNTFSFFCLCTWLLTTNCWTHESLMTIFHTFRHDSYVLQTAGAYKGLTFIPKFDSVGRFNSRLLSLWPNLITLSWTKFWCCIHINHNYFRWNGQKLNIQNEKQENRKMGKWSNYGIDYFISLYSNIQEFLTKVVLLILAIISMLQWLSAFRVGRRQMKIDGRMDTRITTLLTAQ